MIQRFLGHGVGLGQARSAEELKKEAIAWCRRWSHYFSVADESRDRVRGEEERLRALEKEVSEAGYWKREVAFHPKRQVAKQKAAYVRAQQELLEDMRRVDAAYDKMASFYDELKKLGCYLEYDCTLHCPEEAITPAVPGTFVPEKGGWVPTPRPAVPGIFDPMRGGWVPTPGARPVPQVPRPDAGGGGPIPTPTPGGGGGGWPPARPLPQTPFGQRPEWVPPTSPPAGRPLPQTPTPGWGGGVPAATIPPGGLPAFPQSPLTGAVFQMQGPIQPQGFARSGFLGHEAGLGQGGLPGGGGEWWKKVREEMESYIPWAPPKPMLPVFEDLRYMLRKVGTAPRRMFRPRPWVGDPWVSPPVPKPRSMNGSLGQPGSDTLDRATVIEFLVALDTIMKAYNANRDVECLRELMADGPQVLASIRGKLHSWLQTAGPDDRWEVGPAGAWVVEGIVDCAAELDQIIPGIPNPVTYTVGAGAAAGLLALVFI